MRAAVRLEVGDGEAEKSEWNEFNTTRRLAPGSSISRQTKLTRSENLLIQRVPSANLANRRTISVPFSVSCAAFEFIRASTSGILLYAKWFHRRTSMLASEPSEWE